MTKKLGLLTSAALLSLTVAACDDGQKTETSETTMMRNGTVVETNVTRETSMDGDGNVTTEIEKETVVDPEGLMNKKTTTQSMEVETETENNSMMDHDNMDE